MWWAPLLNNIVGFLGEGVAASTNSYESISTVTVPAGGSSSIEFTSIPTTYKHLQIRGIARIADSSDYGYLGLQTGNGSYDTGNNYSFHTLGGDGVSATAASAASQNNIRVGSILPSGVMSSNVFGIWVIDILDYANTSKYKTIRDLGGHDNNGTGSLSNGQKGNIVLTSGSWQSTSAINQIKLYGYGATSNNLVQYSSFALYGVKG